MKDASATADPPGVIRIKDLAFTIAKAEIHGYMSVTADDGRSNIDPAEATIRWEIGVSGAELMIPNADEPDEEPIAIEPHFIDQDLAVVLADWTDLAGKTFAFDAANPDPASASAPCLHIGGGDILPTSLIRIGRRTGARFTLDWSGTCYPMIDDERSGVQPFEIAGGLTFAFFTVAFHDDGQDWKAQAEAILGRRLDLANLRFASARKPYENAGVEQLSLIVHAWFEPFDDGAEGD